MTRLEELYARASPALAHRPGSALSSRAHAWLIRRSGGRVGTRFFRARLLVLRTTGRRSGRVRDAPMICLSYRDGWVVVASNAASERLPAWWLNLQADPEAEVLIDGASHAVRGRRATPDEEEELRPRLRAVYRGFDHYEKRARREIPIVVLEPRPGV